jgi:hypothetical protein
MWSLRPSTLFARDDPDAVVFDFMPPLVARGRARRSGGETWRYESRRQGVEALARLRSRSCIIDGEAVACGDDGIALFERIRYRRDDASVFLYAFDLIELNGDDLRREPLEGRKAALAKLLARAGCGVQLNEHLEAEGPLVFDHACRLGLAFPLAERALTTTLSAQVRRGGTVDATD